jgi:hypothetical protein
MHPQIYHFPSNCEKIITTNQSYKLEDLLEEDEIVTDVKEGKPNIIELCDILRIIIVLIA